MFHLHSGPRTKYVLGSFVIFLIVGLSMMHVFLDVHAINNDQQNAVACCIASSHEDLHEVTSNASCADLNSPSFIPSTVSQGMGLGLEFRSTIKVHSHQQKFFQQILTAGLQTVPQTNFEYGQIHHNLRIHFFIHHAFLTQFLHDLLVTFPKFPTFLIHHDLRLNFLIRHDLLITFLNFFPSRALRDVISSTTSFNSLLLKSQTSSSRYQSNTSLM